MTAPAVRVVGWNLAVFRRMWRTNMLTSFLQPLLYLLGMGLGVGSLVDANTSSADTLGTSYVAFLAPALLATSAMLVGASESTFPVLDGFIWSRYYHAMVATPLRATDLVAGHALWMAIRIGAVGSAVAAAMALVPDARSWGLIPAVPCAVVAGLAFAMPIAAYAATKRTDGGFVGLQRFVIIPLFLFGGAFYPVEQLPSVLEAIAYVTPLWHGVELCRGATLGTLSLLHAVGHLAYLTAWAVAGAVVARRTFSRRLYS